MSPSNALRFFSVVGRLKDVRRAGWVRAGVPEPESVAAHMHRLSLMAMALADPRLCKHRLVQICVVHDLAEAIVGDITPHDGVGPAEKSALELAAMRQIAQDLGCVGIEQELLQLWYEYEGIDPSSSSFAKKPLTLESSVAHQLDKLEMIVQADEYEQRYSIILQDFFDSTANSFSHPEIVAWANELRSQRAIRLANN